MHAYASKARHSPSVGTVTCLALSVYIVDLNHQLGGVEIE